MRSSERRSYVGLYQKEEAAWVSNSIIRQNIGKNIAKGTTDPRVEFISQVITQILIKQFQNFDSALAS